jgi:predicted phage terminase large subunit-like protein
VSSKDFRECSSCKVARLKSTLNKAGICPFCVDKPKAAPEPTPEPPKAEEKIVKKVQKRTTRVKPAPVEKVVPPAAPEEPQTAAIDPEREREAVREEVKSMLAMPYDPPAYVQAKDPLQEMAQRELCRRRLLPFIQRFRPKYLPGWVHADICRRLERFKKQVEEGLSPRLLLMMPPRAGKSEIGSRHFAPWVLGDHPDWEIIAASHTSSLTMSFSRYIRDLMRDPAYQAIFPNTKLDPGSQSVENWNTTKGGGYLAAGVGTGITGRGAHILLLDDLVKDIEAADSDTISENTWEWYASTAYTRLAPGGGVLGIMTWWSETDWAGRIQQVMASGEGDKFEIVKYPAINDEGDEYLLADDSIVQIAPLSKVPEGARMTRPMNTAVHPARYDTEAMLRIKRNLVAAGQKRIWQALYQQNPTPDDGLHFTKGMFKKVPVMPNLKECNIFQAWDFAITENTDSDYTVGSTIAQDFEDNLYVIDVVRFRSSDAIYIVDTILDYWQEWGANFLGFEDGQIWKTMESQFDKRCRERRIYPAWELLKPLTDKLVRAHPLKGRMQAGKVFFYSNGAWYEECERELLRFPGGKHDDQVDSLAWNVRLTLNASAPKDPRKIAKAPDDWRKKLNGMVLGTGGGYMSA